MVTLRTSRLVLRPARAADAEPLHAVFRRPEAMRYWSTPPHADLDETRRWLDVMQAIRPEEGEDFVIERDGVPIGKAGLFRFPEIGFILSPEHWRQGLATEALEAVIARAFTVHNLSRIIADVDPRNAGSLAVLGRLGFRRTGYRERTLLLAGEWCDSVDLALEKAAWALAPPADVP
jgi:[ribosomal protein S5]-alanine N-acetyltransferase